MQPWEDKLFSFSPLPPPYGCISLKPRQIPAPVLTSVRLNANRDLSARPPSCETRLFNCKEESKQDKNRHTHTKENALMALPRGGFT